MTPHVFSMDCSVFSSMRPVALSVASGSISSLLVALARELTWSEALPPIAQDLCPYLTEDRPFLDCRSVLVGICIGILLGPVVDFIHFLRHAPWRRWGTLESEDAVLRSSYRVLNEQSRRSTSRSRG